MMYTKYGNHFFFKISVERDPSLGSDVIIRLKPGDLGMPLYYYSVNESNPIVIGYKRMLSDITTSLGAAISYDAYKYAERLYLVEKMMANVTPSLEIQNDPKQPYHIVTLDHLRNTARGLPIHDILSEYFVDIHITPSTRIWVPSGNYCEKVSDVLSSFDKIELYNAITISTLAKYIRYQNKFLTHGMKKYMSMLTGREYEKKPRWEFCSSLIHELTPMAFIALVQRGIYRSNYEINNGIIHDMYDNIKSAMLKSVHESHMKDNHKKKRIMEKIKSVKLQVGLPSHVTEKSRIEKYHYNLQIIFDNLYKNVINGVQFKRFKLQSILNGENSKNESYYLSIMDASEVVYNKIENAIIIPQYLTNLPHYHQDYAIPILYGRLGVMISEALSSEIYYSHGAYQFDRHDPGHVIDANLTSQKILYECVESSRVRDSGIKLNITNLTMTNTLAHINGVKLASYGLKRKVENYSSKKDLEHISGLEKYEIGEIFYLSYAQSQCSLKTVNLDNWHTVTQFKMKSRELLKLVWMQSFGFSNEFLCPILPSLNISCYHIMQ